MPLDVRTLASRYPWLWHVTSAANAERIERLRRIEPAAALLRVAGRADLLAVRRRNDVELTIDSAIVVMRDQAPLHAGHIAWEPQWNLARFVAALNERVFFWPGHWDQPSKTAGANVISFLSKAPDVVAVLVPSEAIMVDPATPLSVELSRYNTGGPRTSGGVKSPRGASTFVPLDRWPGPPSTVREVAVVGSVDLSPCWNRVRVRTAGELVNASLIRTVSE
jgi:hypothetical protein